MAFYYSPRFGFGELSPVCAVVGGVLAQEVIKVCQFCYYSKNYLQGLILEYQKVGNREVAL